MDLQTSTRPLIAPLDGLQIRADFPIFHCFDSGDRKPLVFLDSASSSQKPAVVIERLTRFYETSNANIHRGVYQLSEMATAQYEEARRIAATFLNALSDRECIFVRNTTEAINLVANSWGKTHLRPGDTILVSLLEHHSNLVPWHLIAEQTGVKISAIPVTDDLRIDVDAYRKLLQAEPKLVAISHVSNSIGTINDVAELTRWAKTAGATVLIDGAQGAPHVPVDVQAIGCDFYAFSGHKTLGPLGSGVLWGRKELLDAMPPFMGGGGMIRKVRIDGSTYADVPARFEPGTPAVADAVGLGTALQYLMALGMDRVRDHERALMTYALPRLADVPGIRLFGTEDLEHRGGVISFELGDVHPHDVAAILDGENVAVRAGHHCNQPLMEHLGVIATTRASFSVYNTPDDVDRLVEGLHRVNRIFAI